MESVGASKHVSDLLAFKRSLHATIAAHAGSADVEQEIARYRQMPHASIRAEALADENLLIAEEERICHEWKQEGRCECVQHLQPHQVPTCTHIHAVLKKRKKEIRRRALARTLVGIETTALRLHLAHGFEDL
jgi:hypothetical protein